MYLLFCAVNGSGYVKPKCNLFPVLHDILLVIACGREFDTA